MWHIFVHVDTCVVLCCLIHDTYTQTYITYMFVCIIVHTGSPSLKIPAEIAAEEHHRRRVTRPGSCRSNVRDRALKVANVGCLAPACPTCCVRFHKGSTNCARGVDYVGSDPGLFSQAVWCLRTWKISLKGLRFLWNQFLLAQIRKGVYGVFSK